MTTLNLKAALQSARDDTGLSDFGSDDFIEPLSVFLDLLNGSELTGPGRLAQAQLVHRCLVNRLRFADDLARHPEILDEDVSDPIVVLGFPRSGTTALQRMISADPAMQSLKLWRVFNPAPFPDEGGDGSVGRIEFAEAIEAAMRTGSPEMFAAHPMIANEAEEDWFLHHLAFRHVGNVFGGLVSFEYLAYLRTLPRLPSYRCVADLLRYLQWQDGGRRGRRWVLKSPVHIGCLPELLSAHPRATLIYPQRDFRTVMASFCYTLECSVGASMPVDPQGIGALAIDFWQEEMRRFRESRKRLGDRLKILEMSYTDLLADPLAHIGQLYRTAGTHLSAEGERAIRRWIADNPAGKHGRNVYRLERYGLTEARIDSVFGSGDASSASA